MSEKEQFFLFFTRIWGQPKFILHDGIAAGIFNMTYNGAGTTYGPWERNLMNSQELLDLLLQRMQRDFESTSAKMRKAWGQSQLDPH